MSSTKKGLFNVQVDALSCLRSLGKITVPVYADIPTYPLYSDDKPTNRNSMDNLDVNLSLTIDSSLSFVSIALDEIRLPQDTDGFCRTIGARLGKGERVLFVLSGDIIFFCSVDGIEQVVEPQSLIPHVLQLSRHAKMPEQQGGRSLYQSLLPIFCWPNMSVDCYAIVRSCVSFAKNMVTLQRNSKGLKLFPAPVPLEFMAIYILGQLFTIKRGNRFLLGISDHFSKLVKTVSL